MRRAHSSRRVPRHHRLLVPPPLQRRDRIAAQPLRISDLILALLAVVLLAGLALAAAFALTVGPATP